MPACIDDNSYKQEYRPGTILFHKPGVSETIAPGRRSYKLIEGPYNRKAVISAANKVLDFY